MLILFLLLWHVLYFFYFIHIIKLVNEKEFQSLNIFDRMMRNSNAIPHLFLSHYKELQLTQQNGNHDNHPDI